MISVEVMSEASTSDLEELFRCDEMTDRCWCMWFIVRVKDFHAAGRDGNRSSLLRLVDESPSPVGLMAYDDGSPVGWCAVGPRNRYRRILKAPTLKSLDRDEDSTVWLVPCFFVKPGERRAGVATALLRAAVELASDHGAVAVEGFPLAGTRKRSGGSDFQTGIEPLFADCGFEPIERPSDNRVIMRRELGGKAVVSQPAPSDEEVDSDRD